MNRLSENPSPSKRPASLALWMTASVAVFVLLGSLALVLAFERHFDREERRAFEGLARANAGFLERTRLPQSETMADQLGEIIGARVFFCDPHTRRVTGKPGQSLDPTALQLIRDGKVNVMPNGEWMVGLPGRAESTVVFLRPASSRGRALGRTDTWLALGGFWLLSLALGWGLARRITRPLRSLAESLPWVGTDRTLPDLPVARRDEIGQLARTLTRTHDSLRDERGRRRVAERHALLGRMATSLAHEVRNPLAAIRLHAQLLAQANPAEAAISRQLIESEALRIEGLVGQWLSHAKPAPLALAEVNLTELTTQAVQLLEPQAAHAKAALCFEPSAGPPVIISADGQRLRQVLGNLLLNAIQAMPHGGRVNLSLLDAGPRVALVVEDQGTGFSPTALEHLGEPFFSEKEGGMGLGLTIVREICEAHGGSLHVGNRTDGGAWVRAEFPKRHSPPRQQAGREPWSDGSLLPL